MKDFTNKNIDKIGEHLIELARSSEMFFTTKDMKNILNRYFRRKEESELTDFYVFQVIWGGITRIFYNLFEKRIELNQFTPGNSLPISNVSEVKFSSNKGASEDEILNNFHKEFEKVVKDEILKFALQLEEKKRKMITSFELDSVGPGECDNDVMSILIEEIVEGEQDKTWPVSFLPIEWAAPLAISFFISEMTEYGLEYASGLLDFLYPNLLLDCRGHNPAIGVKKASLKHWEEGLLFFQKQPIAKRIELLTYLIENGTNVPLRLSREDNEEVQDWKNFIADLTAIPLNLVEEQWDEIMASLS